MHFQCIVVELLWWDVKMMILTKAEVRKLQETQEVRELR